MGIMQNKVSRRIALGTMAGGVAAGAILLRSLRARKLKEADPYGKIDAPPNQITSDLSRDDVEKAFGVLQKERDMWLKFRGVAGRITAVRQPVDADKRALKTVTSEGNVSLTLDLQRTTGSRMGMLLPCNINLVYSDKHNAAPLWSFALESRASQNAGGFSGKEIESISHGELYSLLTVPVSLLTLVNAGIKEMQNAWKVSRNVKSSTEPDSYVFESNGEFTSEGLLPTLGFSGGHLTEFIPKRVPGRAYPIISLKDQVVDNGIAYPRAISMVSSTPWPGNDTITITLSDVKIATA
ncbi:MAG: hypothetical protein ACLP9L_01795 [Thermoguttaceae bacterium]